MLGTPVRGDFEHCEVAVFVGKNPWQSRSFPHARLTLRNIVKDPARAIIVIDPRRTETAELAEFHLQVRPGRDAWLLAAMGAILVEERLIDTAWLGAHASGIEDVVAALSNVSIADYCGISGVQESLVRAATRRIARASSVAVFEDLGVQMNRHSTLVSYLEKLMWLLTGNLGKAGAQYAPATFVPIVRASRNELDPATAPRSPETSPRKSRRSSGRRTTRPPQTCSPRSSMASPGNRSRSRSSWPPTTTPSIPSCNASWRSACAPRSRRSTAATSPCCPNPAS